LVYSVQTFGPATQRN